MIGLENRNASILLVLSQTIDEPGIRPPPAATRRGLGCPILTNRQQAGCLHDTRLPPLAGWLFDLVASKTALI